MKPPLKAFTVEVKRSRSHTPPAKSVVNAPPVFIEARPAPVSVSQARQVAEKMFTSLTISLDVEPRARMSAESVFRQVAPPAAAAAEPNVLAAQASSVNETVLAKPRKPRAAKTPATSAPASKVVKPVAAYSAKAPAPDALRDPQRDRHGKPPELSSSSEKVDRSFPLSSATEATQWDRQNWGWRPGERWKKRLRHLRHMR
jgi:hypothetical protein